mmetsp:Transcript_14068/g.42463  ORF Transcript_14068/g.42463 Transcript_14068/m.42463 type:complete len:167 (-) Transcript_14068:97-597(-)|eukprot:CAMPEP_0206141484 /NCGR_PEP_ID=MMETSP1473-20131121/13098_1 /ASSEMBLY_ACC=CAM_ASM_001109 /TAXON_ID=1461547 /ORGANISM="Stichococcus sp, Strain RCC1054" /LENGTH=166 /DNA_ID=CAMNT_0053536075 /DNA_START=213 /DNA_END=713 /DNA_ORIENTATION=+
MAAQDLLDSIEMRKVECLNQKGDGIGNVLKQGYRDDPGLVLESDTDEQLLIHIPFQNAVKLHSLTITSGAGDHAPRRFKLFTNRASLGFSEANSEVPVQQFDLTEENLSGTPVILKYVKFQAVTHLTIFIEDNHGDDELTRLEAIRLFGSSGQSMDVAAIKKVEDQ